MQTRELTYAKAINEATDQMMQKIDEVYLIGLGVPDPKGIFGTTSGLQDKYGPNRVMDMPVSENAMMGIIIGSALVGMRPILTHQRADFFYLALDQLINNGSKWHYMFGGQSSVPVVIRLIIGRGWGQGPQHSQSIHSMLSHFPGLKVVMPSSAYDAKGLLVSAIEDNNPVVFIEHRWLHNITGSVPKDIYSIPIGKCNILKQGTDVTIVASSHMTLEACRADEFLKENQISAEIIDLRTVSPLDKNTIFESVRKTGRLLVLDPDWGCCGIAGEIIASVSESCFHYLKTNPRRITYSDRLIPTSWSLSNFYYPIVEDVVAETLDLLGKQKVSELFKEKSFQKKKTIPLDVPDSSFTGPF